MLVPQPMNEAHPKDEAGLTVAQRAVLVAVAELRTELGRCPAVREVARRMGLKSTNDMWQRILRLTNQGYVQRGEFGKYHTLQPTDLGWKISGVDSGGLTLVGLDRPHRCARCAAVTFKPHKPETCRQLISGQTFAEQSV